MKEKNVFKIVKKYYYKWDLLICFVLAFLFSVSPRFQNNSDYILKADLDLICNFIKFFIYFFICTIIFRLFLNKIIKNEKESKIDKIFDLKYSFLLVAFLLFICWIPIIFCLYPGSLNNDGWGQINNIHYKIYLGGNPLFTTFVIAGSIYNLSKLYNGNWQFAIFTYTFIQTIVFSFVLSYTLIYARKKLKINSKILLVFLIIYCFLPLFPCTIQAISKDTFFSGVYVLFFINYLEIVRTNAKCLNSIKNIILTIILAILCCLTKKIGIYIVIISYLLLIIIYYKEWKNILFSILVLLCFFTFINVINKSFSIIKIINGPGGAQYSLLFQQTARYAKYYGDEISKEDKETISKVLNYSLLADSYNPINSDGLRMSHYTGTDRENYSAWLEIWKKQGLKHPKVYIDATLAMISGWFSFREYKPLMNMDWHDQLDTSVLPERVTIRPSINKDIANYIQKLYDKIANFPIFNIILSFGFIAAIIPAFTTATILKYKKNKKNIKVWVRMFSNTNFYKFRMLACTNFRFYRRY